MVPAFAKSLQKALHTKAEVIALLHDDLLIQEDGWDVSVLNRLSERPECGLTGFGGGQGLGDSDIYRVKYKPIQLARQGFVSNMQDAELHGRRWKAPVRLACLDGFSQIGRRDYWLGNLGQVNRASKAAFDDPLNHGPNLFQRMADLGIVHHAYDAALGCYAKRLGWEVWLTPVACHHKGGETAVADRRYHDWAKTQHPDGDIGSWEDAHKTVYDEFVDVLPILMED